MKAQASDFRYILVSATGINNTKLTNDIRDLCWRKFHSLFARKKKHWKRSCFEHICDDDDKCCWWELWEYLNKRDIQLHSRYMNTSTWVRKHSLHFLLGRCAFERNEKFASLSESSQFVLLIETVGETHVALPTAVKQGKIHSQSVSVGVFYKQLLGWTSTTEKRRENEALSRVFCFLHFTHLSQAFSKRLTRTVDCGYREES